MYNNNPPTLRLGDFFFKLNKTLNCILLFPMVE